MKTTLISIYYRGTRHPFLVPTWVNESGNTVMMRKSLDNILAAVGYIPGTTYSLGA
jgi:hypothetical protein